MSCIDITFALWKASKKTSENAPTDFTFAEKAQSKYPPTHTWRKAKRQSIHNPKLQGVGLLHTQKHTHTYTKKLFHTRTHPTLRSLRVVHAAQKKSNNKNIKLNLQKKIATASPHLMVQKRYKKGNKIGNQNAK